MEEEEIGKIIVNNIIKNTKSFFLIQDSNLEKNNLDKYLISNQELKNYNFILLSSKNICNYKNFYSFFNFSKIKEFSKITFPINNKHISIEHIDYYNKKNYKITPVFDSNEYKDIFKKKKYNILDNEFDYDNNILIIKNIEEISYEMLKFLNYNLKIIFKKKKFFGGIKLIFIGDINYKIFKTTIYDLSLYEDKKKKEYIFLKKFNIYTIKTKPYLVKYIKFYQNIQNKNEINFNFFFNAYQLDIDFYQKTNLNFLKYFTFISNLENIVQEINEKENNKLKKKKYIEAETYIDNNLFDLLNKNLQLYYLNIFEKNLFVCKNLKIIFLKDLYDLKIKKGTIGFIKKIVFNNNFNNNNNKITINDIKYIKVKINNLFYLIKPYNLILKEKNNIFYSMKQFPFKSAWCVNTKFLKYLNLENIVIVLSENLPFYVLDKCFKKSKNILFKNTFHLTNKMFFKSSMLDEKLYKKFLFE